MTISFEWDDAKNTANIAKHNVSFDEAQLAFFDPYKLVAFDALHSNEEERWFCIGKVGDKILTVRFTYRQEKIRIIGAAEWRKGRKYYEERP
jgi:uncharacterized DUF497 family protein